MPNFNFTVINNAPDIRNIIGQIEVNDQNNIFQSAYWFHNLIDDRYISFTAADDAGKIQQALHLKIDKRFDFKIAELAGEPYCQYNDVINNSDQSVDAFFEKVITHLKSQGVDALYLHNVRADAHIWTYCEKKGRIVAEKQAPWIDLSKSEDHPAFVKAMGKNIPRVYRKLFRETDAVCKTYIDAEVTPDLLRQVIKLKAQQLDAHGQTSRVFDDPAKIDKMVEMLATPSPDLKTIIATITIDGVLASASISHAKANVHYGYIIAMDTQFIKYSPGNAQVIQNVLWAYENGITVFDFLSPADGYKLKWTKNNYTSVYDVVLPLSRKGNLYVSIYLKNLRPKMKSAYLYIKNSKLYKALKK